MRVTLLAYGRGSGTGPADLEVLRSPAWLSPVPLRAGPHPGKGVADAALLGALMRAHAARRFDAVLAHHAEAAGIAIAARRWLGAPVVYVAHTLLATELPTYAPARAGSALARIGEALDRELARRADAVLALSRWASRRLARHTRTPVQRLAPPWMEPPAPPPAPERVARSLRRHGLRPGGFVLYAGNLDAYQDLPLLAEAARGLDVPVVAVTHARRGQAPAPLRTLRVSGIEEMRHLCHAAAVAVLPRRRPGGFPVKLLNYMEAARAIVAYAPVADTLEAGRSGWLLAPSAGAREWRQALRRLLAEPRLAESLGREAQRVYRRVHSPERAAALTLSLLGQLGAGAGSLASHGDPVHGGGSQTEGPPCNSES